MRVVADTNVLISGFVFTGLPCDFINRGLNGEFHFITSQPLLDELEEKLSLKFKIAPEDVQVIRERLISVSDVIHPMTMLHVIKEDRDDNRVLECAVEGHADFIVSGDRHLLKLIRYEGIEVLSVRQFLDRKVRSASTGSRLLPS